MCIDLKKSVCGVDRTVIAAVSGAGFCVDVSMVLDWQEMTTDTAAR